MRIEAYTQVQQLYNAKKTTKTAQPKSVSNYDKIQISSIGRDFQVAKSAVGASSDIREDVTAPIKAGIKSGTYHVSGESFAEKLMQEYEARTGFQA